MTKTQLRKALRTAGEKDTNQAIANLFGIKEQAVQAWTMHGPIPELRRLQLEKARPELFTLKARK